MAYTPHDVVKAQKLSAAFIPLVGEHLLLPNFMNKQSIDIFKGTLGDTLTFKVPGVVAAREYEFRNDRTNPITFDTFEERTIDVSVGGNAYSAVALTDEQKEFDLLSWAQIMPMQAEAVAEHLNRMAASVLEGNDITYASGRVVPGVAPVVTIGVAEGNGNMRKAFFGARSILNQFRTGNGARVIVVGSNFELALQMDEKLTLADAVGDDIASTAVREATIGRVAGFNVVVDQTVDPDVAYAFTSNAHVFVNGAPQVPNSVPYGTTVSAQGLSMRHMIDYDMLYYTDRSSVNTWYGFAPVTDVYRIWDDANKRTLIGEQEHFTRMIKLELDAPAAFTGTAELTAATGVDLASVEKVSSTV